ncbi:MAG TPA: dipeptidase [Chloroflexota bacterium]|nr:dipeptidase [Chloroflexota bacterium]
MEPTPEAYIDAHREPILARLLDFLRIPSVSTDPAHGADITAAANWVAARLREAGIMAVEVLKTAGHPVVYAEWLGAPGRPTLLVYGHYDVQPPDPLDEWRSAPFSPEIREGRIYARGASDDKGPMFIPLAVAEAFLATEGRIPVNLKFLIEGEEEIGSPHLAEFVARHADKLAADYALSADGAMWRPTEPSLTLGSRGLVALDLEIRGAHTDLHSGRHGGAVRNPLHALAELVAGLHRADGSVAVPGFYDGVEEPNEADRRQMAQLGFDEEAYRAAMGVPALYGEEGYSTLERQWYRPTLEVNGLYGGYQGVGSKTVVPSVAHAKITCRLAPGQMPDEVLRRVTDHLRIQALTGVATKVSPHAGGAPAYRINAAHPGLRLAHDVLQHLYGTEPAVVLMGGTLPISDIFHRVLGIDTIYFSFSTADEDFHAPNEFFRVSRLWEGIAAWIDFWRRASEYPLPSELEEAGNPCT